MPFLNRGLRQRRSMPAMLEPAAAPLSSCATISGEMPAFERGKGGAPSVKPRPDDLTSECATTSLQIFTHRSKLGCRPSEADVG